MRRVYCICIALICVWVSSTLAARVLNTCLAVNVFGFADCSLFRDSFSGIGGRPLGESATTVLALLPSITILSVQPGARQVWWAAGLLAPAAALVLTFSRGVYIAAGCFVVLAVFFIVRSGVVLLSRVLPTLGLLGAGVAIVVLAGNGFRAVGNTAAMGRSEGHSRSVNGRFVLWQRTRQLIGAHLLLGTGSSNFALSYTAARQSVDSIPFVGRPMNIVLDLAAEKGLIGLAAYSSFFFACVVVSVDVWRRRGILPKERAAAAIVATTLIALLVRDAAYSSILRDAGTSSLAVFWAAHNSSLLASGQKEPCPRASNDGDFAC
jgi:O-antigen ligase